MVIKGEYKCKHAIVLTQDLMKEIDALFQSKFLDISYRAILKNGSEVEFSSLDEMLDYENAFQQKLEKATVFGSITNLHATFEPRVSFFFNFSSTVEVRYTFQSTDDENAFRANLKRIFNKAKAPCSFLYQISYMQLILTIFALGFVNTIIRLLNNSIFESKNLSFSVFNLVIYLTFIFMLIMVFIKKIWQSIYPPIVFLWGEEVKNNRRRTETRKVFWGIFVTLLIGIISSVIYGLIS